MSFSMSPEKKFQHRRTRTLSTRYEASLESKARGRSIDKSPHSTDKSTSAYTFEEGELEADVYFPTFARRGSENRGQVDTRRFSTSSRLLEKIPAASDDEDSSDHSTSRETNDHDDIFALDHETDEGELNIKSDDVPIRFRGKTMRRISDESSSSTSTSTRDIRMVWDEEDHERDDTIQIPTKMVRQDSGSSFIQSSSSPKWGSKQSRDTTINLTRMPSLPFVRKPSDNVITPLQSYQWGISARGTSTTVVSRSNSVTSIQFDPRNIEHYNKKQQSTSYSASSSPQIDRGNSFLLTPSSPMAKKKESKDVILGRKRSATDPIVLCSLLEQIPIQKSSSQKYL